MNDNRERAKEGEDHAAVFLANAGYEILDRNYRYGHGEIDIIARDGETTVFVEVKTRTSAAFGHPLYSITPAKQRQLLRVAQGYIYERRYKELACRFDVVTVEFERGKPVLQHLKNAFIFMP